MHRPKLRVELSTYSIYRDEIATSKVYDALQFWNYLELQMDCCVRAFFLIIFLYVSFTPVASTMP